MNTLIDSDYNNDDFEFDDDFAGMELTGDSPEEIVILIIDLDNQNAEKTYELFDPNFETELGCTPKIFTDQDIIDQEFSDVASLNIVQASGDDKSGKKVIIFYACRMPPVNEIDLNRLWEYTVRTMKQFVSNDYSLIYFHYGLTNKNNPGIRFMLNAYKQIDRDFKKNLKNLYIVHPSAMLKFIIGALLPFFSQKVKTKIIKIRTLKELDSQFYLDQMVVPEVIKIHDAKLNSPESVDKKFHARGDYHLSNSNLIDESPNPQFGVTLQQIRHIYPGHLYPPIMEQCIDYLRKECLESEGLFRRCTSKMLLEEAQRKFNKDEYVDLEQYGDPHLTACLLKTFLRSLREPLMTFDLHDDIIKIHSCTTDDAVNHIRGIITESLPDYNYHVLKYLVEFLKEVAVFSDKNKMTLQNLANVFAPSLSWSRNESSIVMIHIIIKFTYLLLLHSADIFIKKDIYTY